METQLLINKLSIVKDIIKQPNSDIEWGIDKINSIIADLERELRQPDVIKFVCDCTHTQACKDCAESKGIDWTIIEQR